MIAAITAVGLLLVLVPRLLNPAAVFAMAGFVRPRAAEAPVGAWPTVTCVRATREAPDGVSDRVADFLALDYAPELPDVAVAMDATATSLLTPAIADVGGPRVRVVAGDAPGASARRSMRRCAQRPESFCACRTRGSTWCRTSPENSQQRCSRIRGSRRRPDDCYCQWTRTGPGCSACTRASSSTSARRRRGCIRR